ncbi:hypothetical protein [Henriciella sp.]|uniref:hypothetical protein n=1 Tax=Henriciella sp. TaxID=1968823 RepID=UPI00260D61AF|nr:hypothetical protein [Henriciella sp.]
MPRLTVSLVAAIVALPATAQIATSNEDGATGAYSNEVDSSFTSESRFGPRTAIDDLRADVDRDKEQIERVRQKLLQERQAPTRIEPFVPPPAPEDEREQPEQ